MTTTECLAVIAWERRPKETLYVAHLRHAEQAQTAIYRSEPAFCGCPPSNPNRRGHCVGSRHAHAQMFCIRDPEEALSSAGTKRHVAEIVLQLLTTFICAPAGGGAV